MKIALITQSGMYNHELNALARHAKTIRKAQMVGVPPDEKEIFRVRVDHVDVAIYFDRNHEPRRQTQINGSMIIHALQLAAKGIRVLFITNHEKPGEYGSYAYRVWSIHSGACSFILEVSVIDEVFYHFDSDKIYKMQVDRSFRSLDWGEFQRRFLSKKKR